MKRLFGNKHFIELCIFCVIGVINTVIDFSIYVGLTRVFDLFYLYANVTSVLVAMFVGFWLHKHVTFKNKSKEYVSQGLKFFVIGTVGFLLHNGIMYLLVDLIEIHDIISKIVAVAFVTAWSYGAQKWWAFAHKG